MKHNIKTILTAVILMMSCTIASSQEVTKAGGYTISFESNDQTLDPKLKKRLIHTFFEVYPKLAKAYNKNTDKNVRFFVDTSYDGVAATGGGRVTFSARYLQAHPEDIDVVTHEVMHIVQDYGHSNGPGWLTEGIADYARYKFGVDNQGAQWSLPEFQTTQKYTDSYRVTARFLAWIEKYTPGTVKSLDASLRGHTFQNETWVKVTGKSLEDLWTEYLKNPRI